MRIDPSRPGLMTRLVMAQQTPVVGVLPRLTALALGVDIPPTVRIGADLRLQHRAHGVVLHHKTTIGDRVRIFHNVTVGRADPHAMAQQDRIDRFVIGDDVWLCAGAVVLGDRGTVTIGRGTVIGANAVVLGSTGEYEVWGGVPARMLGERREPLRNVV